jgi:hypothetical protein
VPTREKIPFSLSIGADWGAKNHRVEKSFAVVFAGEMLYVGENLVAAPHFLESARLVKFFRASFRSIAISLDSTVFSSSLNTSTR